MVLQQGMPLTIRGTAEPGEQVTVELADHSASTQADDSGHWQVALPALKAGHDAYTLTVSGNNTITLEDVLIGEVKIARFIQCCFKFGSSAVKSNFYIIEGYVKNFGNFLV